jgi:hypothetical protein
MIAKKFGRWIFARTQKEGEPERQKEKEYVADKKKKCFFFICSIHEEIYYNTKAFFAIKTDRPIMNGVGREKQCAYGESLPAQVPEHSALK